MSAEAVKISTGWCWFCTECRARVGGYLLQGSAQNAADDHNRTAHEGE